MSDVYEALDEQNGASVALKIVRSGDPEFVRRLTQEALALESFEHPGLIRLLDTGLAGDQAYLVMELINGPTLATALRNGPLGSRGTAALGARLADALAYVHERGIVHRDVKPSNILLAANGDAWLGDFGIARLHDASTLTATGTTMGTVSYMAPEQLENHQVGPAADVWSLGIVLLECLTGRRVYEGPPSEVVARRMAGPVPLPADLPAPWRLVLSGMLEHRPELRPDGSHVAALLSTSAFDAPWMALDGDATTRLAAVARDDHTALMPGVVAAAALDGDATRIVKPTRPAAPPTRPTWLRSRMVPGAVALVALGIGLFFLLQPNSSNAHPGPTTKPTVTTTSTTTTTTTTTTVPVGTTALATLTSDIAAGQAAGNVDAASGQIISQQAGLAVTDFAASNTSQAANDLQQAAIAIANGLQSGAITSDQGAVLQSDLSVLASALSLSSSVSPPTTTTTVTGPGPGPGNGNGNGNGNGH